MISKKMMMQTSIEVSLLSNAPDKKVGAVAFKNKKELCSGYNRCIDKDNSSTVDSKGVTKEETLHAEEVMILEALKNNIDLQGSCVYLTHSPCKSCAAKLHYAGVEKVVYLEFFAKSDGVSYLIRNKILVEKYKE